MNFSVFIEIDFVNVYGATWYLSKTIYMKRKIYKNIQYLFIYPNQKNRA